MWHQTPSVWPWIIAWKSGFTGDKFKAIKRMPEKSHQQRFMGYRNKELPLSSPESRVVLKTREGVGIDELFELVCWPLQWPLPLPPQVWKIITLLSSRPKATLTRISAFPFEGRYLWWRVLSLAVPLRVCVSRGPRERWPPPLLPLDRGLGKCPPESTQVCISAVAKSRRIILFWPKTVFFLVWFKEWWLHYSGR